MNLTKNLARVLPILAAVPLMGSPAVAQDYNTFVYHGGNVIERIVVVPVLYGAGNYAPEVQDASNQPSVVRFYGQVLGSSYLDWLSEYNGFYRWWDGSQPIEHGSVWPWVITIAPEYTGSPEYLGSTPMQLLTDGDIQAELTRQIQMGALPYITPPSGHPYSEMYYAIFFPPGYDILANPSAPPLGQSHSCSSGGFCAYHGAVANVPGYGEAYYGVFPDGQSGCYEGCGATGSLFDQYTQVASHELVEAITDPEITLYTGSFPPTSTLTQIGWYEYYASSGTVYQDSEIADVCQGTSAPFYGGDGVTYSVATAWSNASFQTGGNACIATRGHATRFYGSPTNLWWPSPFYGTVSNGTRLTYLTDIDGDGRADLLGLGAGYIGVTRSTGTVGNNFGAYEGWLGSSFYGTHGTVVGALGHDPYGNNEWCSGCADIVSLNDSSVTVMRSNGDGLSAVQTWSTGPFYGSHGTFLGDVNGDGYADLVGAGDGYVGVLPSTGTSFGGYQTWLGSTFAGVNGTFVSDMNGDGYADMVAVNSGSVTVRLSTGTAFAAAQTWYAQSFFGVNGTLLGDVNGDRRPDLVALNNGSVTVLLNSGSSTFLPPQQWYNGTFYGVNGTLLGDVNGDSFADLIALNSGSVSALLAAP